MEHYRYGKENFASYGELFKTAALFGLKRGLAAGVIGATLAAVLEPELRQHLVALYSIVIPTAAVGVTAAEVVFSPLEATVIGDTPN